MVVVYRDLHCSLCKAYLAQLKVIYAEFRATGVYVFIVLGDPKAKAQLMADATALILPTGLRSERGADAGAWSLRLRSSYLHETDQPFFEPGLFVINGDGLIHTLDVSHSPFVRPDLRGALNGITFIRKNNYPIRATHSPRVRTY